MSVTKISLTGRSRSRGQYTIRSLHILSVLRDTNPARLVKKPLSLNFREVLQRFNQYTSPITLVCAGNRRKEQNIVRKSKGFSWGAAGLSTALFTGPMMADVLRAAKPLRKAKYLCMEGADKLVSWIVATRIMEDYAAANLHSLTATMEHPSS